MNLPYYIARKYFFSGKISGVIHIIAGISLLGITMGSIALITILSTFNGFEELVNKMYNTFDSDIKITPKQGKYFRLTDKQLDKIRKLPNIRAITPVIEENALVKFGQRQTIATIKAIEPGFIRSMGIDTLVENGSALILDDNTNFALVGAGVAIKLDVTGRSETEPLQLFEPKKGDISLLNPEEAFVRKNILPGGVFSTLEEFDNKYILLPLKVGRELTKTPLLATAYEISLKDDEGMDQSQEEIQSITGRNIWVKTRFQQQPMLYKVMHSEKFAVYLILSFVILIAAFNLVGCLFMLALEKQKDMMTLISMGMETKMVEDIILYEGMLISGVGGLGGVLIGTIICILQMKFEFFKIAENSTFVYNAYPVAFKAMDFVAVIITVLFLGFIASWFPARSTFRKLTAQDLKH